MVPQEYLKTDMTEAAQHAHTQLTPKATEEQNNVRVSKGKEILKDQTRNK